MQATGGCPASLDPLPHSGMYLKGRTRINVSQTKIIYMMLMMRIGRDFFRGFACIIGNTSLSLGGIALDMGKGTIGS